MSWNKRKEKALESAEGAILRFRKSLTREDEEGWKFYRELRLAFKEMVARAKVLCGCQRNDRVSDLSETRYCCCFGSKQAECRCR